MSRMNIVEFEMTVARLAERNDLAFAVVRNEARTQRMVQVNLQHLQRLRPKLQRYAVYVPNDGETFDYSQKAADLIDTAEEYEIELQDYLDECLCEQQQLSRDSNPNTPAARKEVIGNCSSNVKLTIPVFSGEYSEYPKYRNMFLTVRYNYENETNT